MKNDFEKYANKILVSSRFALAKLFHQEVDIKIDAYVIRLFLPKDNRSQILLYSLAHKVLKDKFSGILCGEIIWIDRTLHGNEFDRPPFSLNDYNTYGHVAYRFVNGIHITDYLTRGITTLYDEKTRLGIFLSKSLDDLDRYIKASSFLTLFSFMLRNHNLSVIHASSVGYNGKGVLLVGSSGSGKSTTALSALLSNKLDLLSDDRCLVRLNPQIEAFNIYNSVKVNQDMLRHLPVLSDLIFETDSFYNSKALAFLFPKLKNRITSKLKIISIIIPRISNFKVASIKSTTPLIAFKALAPNSVVSLPGAGSTDFSIISKLVSNTPCYTLDLAEDLKHNSEVIFNHILENA